jgi:ferredoxin--NADP+ reductase
MSQPGSAARPLRVAVIGSGPSAFYAVEALQKVGGLTAEADVFDRLPTPFGLVRGGVAPDHQNIKAVVKVYEKIAAHAAFRFFGNVRIGRDLTVAELAARYDVLIFAFGCESDLRLGIPGEELAGVHAATEFVGWYNGHPDFRDRSFALAEAQRVAVVGNGNVAMDVTRILIQEHSRLQETDIADHALATLQQSRVREIHLLGRRGPAQAAFSPKEIEEIAELPGVDLVVDPAQAELDPLSAAWLPNAPRSAQRNVKFLAEQAAKGPGTNERKVHCHFLVAPERLDGEGGRVRRILLRRCELVADESGTPRAKPTERTFTLDVDLVFKAIGYRGVPVPGVPFDERKGIVPNQDGRVLQAPGGARVPGQYVVGWAKRGPTGLIGTNSPDSKATVEKIVEDLPQLPARALPPREQLDALLRQRGVDFVSYADWQRLDRWEQEQGKPLGRARCKLTSVDELMQRIRALR